MIIPEYAWRDPKNVIGFAAACAREAVAFHKGPKRKVLVQAIELAEAASRGEKLSQRMGRRRMRACRQLDYLSYPSSHATIAAAYAVSVALKITHGSHTVLAFYTALDRGIHNSHCAGVPRSTIDRLRLRWIIKDMGGDPETTAGRAMYALLTIDAIDEARAIIEESAVA